MKGLRKSNFKKAVTVLLTAFFVFSTTSFATPFISEEEIKDKQNFEQYITKMYNLDENDPKYIKKLEDAVYDYKNRYTMYVDNDYVLGKPNKRQSAIVYYQPGVQEPTTSIGNGEVIDIDPGSAVTPPCGEWYNNASSMAVDSQGEELYGGIKFYSSLPWAPRSDTYFFDTDVATEDAYNWINAQGSSSLSKSANWAKSANGRICKGVGYTVPNYLRGSGWHQKEGAYVSTIEGVDCVGVAVPPCVVDRSYNNGFQQGGPWQRLASADASYYNYAHKKMCIVLEGNGGTIYVPCTNADAKGHTFPGGVMQTNCKAGGVNGNIYSVYVAQTTGDIGGGIQSWPGNQIAHNMSTITSAGVPPVNYTYNVCEAYCWSPTLIRTLQSQFRVIGYVVWP